MSRIRFSFWVRHWISRLDIRSQSCTNSSLFCNDFLHGPHFNTTICIARNFSPSGTLLHDDTPENVKPSKLYVNPAGKVEKKKVPTGEQIFLIKNESDRKKLYLNEAQKLAKHRGLRLVKVGVDYNTAIYKLAKASNLIDQDQRKKKRDIDKKTKDLIISQSSADHDIQYKFKNLIKSVKKGWKGRVVIEKSSQSDKSNEIMSMMESLLPPDCKIEDKVEKKSRTTFTLTSTVSTGDNNEETGKNMGSLDVGECKEQDNKEKSSGTEDSSEQSRKRAENVD